MEAGRFREDRKLDVDLFGSWESLTGIPCFGKVLRFFAWFSSRYVLDREFQTPSKCSEFGGAVRYPLPGVDGWTTQSSMNSKLLYVSKQLF